MYEMPQSARVRSCLRPVAGSVRRLTRSESQYSFHGRSSARSSSDAPIKTRQVRDDSAISMGVNATGTLGGGSRVERRRRENREAVGGEGSGVWGGAVPLPRKCMYFSSKNGVMWCILGVLFLRFICSMYCSCMINFIDENDSDLRLVKILGGRDHCNLCGVDAYGNIGRTCCVGPRDLRAYVCRFRHRTCSCVTRAVPRLQPPQSTDRNKAMMRVTAATP